VSRADTNTFADNDIVSADPYEYYLVYGVTIKIEDYHFSNDRIYAASGANKVTIEDSGTIQINGRTTNIPDS
jgi:hypothetical protein